MIEVENLTKRYGEEHAAGGLGFVVQPGVVVGFLGPNGVIGAACAAFRPDGGRHGPCDG